MQALHQIQALNGLTPATTLVNGVTNNTVSMQPTAMTAAAAAAHHAQAQSAAQAASGGIPVAASHQAVPTSLATAHHLSSPTANPYQGAGLSSATTATAQPASAVNLLALQQLLASNAAGTPTATQLALTNGAQGNHPHSYQECSLEVHFLYFYQLLGVFSPHSLAFS